jgi:hypothetical protein
MTTAGLAALLQASTVRVDIGGKPNGSGFFVSTTHVVTCAHVLEPLLATSSGARPSLGLVDGSGRTHSIAGEPVLRRDHDLALLQLEVADTSVAVALLGSAYALDDNLFSFGYPDGKAGGDPSTFQVEGSTGGPNPHLKFKRGQVRSGSSGSPLLNLRTGAVCAVVRRTRDERQDLGGYGIPVATLHAAFPEVAKLNSAAHRGDTRWMTQLSEDQRQAMGVGSPGPAAYLNFVVTIGQRDAGWCVSASIHPDGGTIESIVVDLNTLRLEVPRLFRAWKAQGRINDADQGRLLGRILYRSIVPGGLATELERLISEKQSVHVSLYFETGMDADLVHLPWEQLHVEGTGSVPTSLGVAPRLTLTRVLNPAPREPLPAQTAEATVLVVTPPVRSLSRDVSDLGRDLVDVIGKLSGLTVVGGTGELSLEDLTARFGDEGGEGADIMHYLGFGQYEDLKDVIALASFGAPDVEFLTGEECAQSLRLHPPRLVVLQTCAGQSDAVPADPTVLAPPLLDAGVDAVVAFPFPLLPIDAQVAASSLYEALAAGRPVREAVQEARRALRRAPWSRPALFMRSPADVFLVRPDA